MQEEAVSREETIVVVTEDTEDPSVDGRRGWGEIRQRLTKAAEIPVLEIERNMHHFLQVMQRVFQQTEQQLQDQPKLRLDEVELQVEISAKGEVKLFAGGEASGKGVIKLKFKSLNQSK